MFEFLFYCYLTLFIFWYLGGYKILNKISDDKSWQISQEWDCKLHNWLCEDHLKIEIPRYAYHLDGITQGKAYSINSPLGEIWIGNYPYCFGGLGMRGLEPTKDTKEKLFKRLSEYGLTFDEKEGSFVVDKSAETG
jgi:hypothetical protein